MIDTRLLIKQLLSQCNQDKSLAQIIFAKLFEEIPEQLRQIETALQLNNFSLAKETTHTLHGSIKFCGFSVFQEDVNALEMALTQRDIDLSRRYFAALHDRLLDFLAQQDEIKLFFEQ